MIRGELLTKVVAYFHGEKKYQESIIRALLGIQRSAYFDHLAKARKRGWLLPESFAHNSFGYPELQSVIDVADHIDIRPQLMKKLDRFFAKPEERIFIRRSDDGPLPMEGRAERFGEDPQKARICNLAKGGASIVERWLIGSSSVGVTWGGVVLAFLNELERRKPTPVRNSPLRVLPLCGEPFDADTYETLSSNLAAKISRIMTGSEASALSLRGIPAVLPYDCEPNGEMERYIRRNEDYLAIFGRGAPRKREGAAANVDMIITGIGDENFPWKMGGKPLWELSLIKGEVFKASVKVEMGGIFIPRTGIPRSLLEDFQNLSSNWTGITKEIFWKVAKSAEKDEKKPGVVVLAAGSEKASYLYEAIKLGLVNRAIIDLELAQALLKAFDK